MFSLGHHLFSELNTLSDALDNPKSLQTSDDKSENMALFLLKKVDNFFGKFLGKLSALNLDTPVQISQINDLYLSTRSTISYSYKAYKTHKLSKQLKLFSNQPFSVENSKNLLFYLNSLERLSKDVDFENKLASIIKINEEIISTPHLDRQQLHIMSNQAIKELKEKLDAIKDKNIHRAILSGIHATASGVIVGTVIATLVKPTLLPIAPLVIIAAQLVKNETAKVATTKV